MAVDRTLSARRDTETAAIIVMMKRKANEQPTDLLFWLADGSCGRFRARVAADTELSIGRTDSKRALGFIVSRGKARVDFVLDTDQVAELAAYLQIALPGLLKPLGRKPDQISLAALVPQPKRKPKRPR
jgi:hypothetical protein